jgi:quercetin dioxygenase-like cupin family protein
LLGPTAFILMELPETGTAGTGLDQPCLTDHHGIVTKGTFSVHAADGSVTTFNEGEAFYVPPGPPEHTFSSSGGCVVSGFAPISEPPDTSTAALAAQGFEVVPDPGQPLPPPAMVSLAGAVTPFTRPGAISVEGSRMGAWLFMRSQFGPRSGFTSGICDVPHWGVVLDGEITISYATETELASRGDVFFAAPGHRFASPDGATVADYTPIADLGAGRIAAWRKAAIARMTEDPFSTSPSARAVVAEKLAEPMAARSAPLWVRRRALSPA